MKMIVNNDHHSVPVLLLGSTGNIGTLTLQALKELSTPLLGISFYNSYDKALSLAKEFKIPYLFCLNESLKDRIDNKDLGSSSIYFGKDALNEFIRTYDKTDFTVINAMIGINGLESSYETLKRNKKLVIANKESIILGGSLLLNLATYENQIIPMDSEHFSLFFLKSLLKDQNANIETLLITASGGPFLKTPLEKLKEISIKDALNHPIWGFMGKNITISSATMANKGLEVMETKELFKVPVSKIKVLVHPQAQNHAMLKLSNGSYLSHLYQPSMAVPIKHALMFPAIPIEPSKTSGSWSLSYTQDYMEVDYQKFPMLSLAYEATKDHHSQILYTIANDFANTAFIEGKIKFLDIYHFVHYILNSFENQKFGHIQDVLNYIKIVTPLIDNKLKEFY